MKANKAKHMYSHGILEAEIRAWFGASLRYTAAVRLSRGYTARLPQGWNNDPEDRNRRPEIKYPEST